MLFLFGKTTLQEGHCVLGFCLLPGLAVHEPSHPGHALYLVRLEPMAGALGRSLGPFHESVKTKKYFASWPKEAPKQQTCIQKRIAHS